MILVLTALTFTLPCAVRDTLSQGHKLAQDVQVCNVIPRTPLPPTEVLQLILPQKLGSHKEVVYVLVAKAASSTMRHHLCQASCERYSATLNATLLNRIWFSVVRDPVERTVSSFWECLGPQFLREHRTGSYLGY